MAIRDYDRLFIGGDWVAPEGTDTIAVISPSTEEVIARVPDGTEADIDKAVAAARTAFDHGPWPRMTPAERGAILAGWRRRSPPRWATWPRSSPREMGSPITFSGMGQVLAPTMIFSYYADLATSYAFDEVRAGLLNPQVLVTKEPVGRRRRHRAVERAALHRRRQAGALAGRRLHRRLQAGARDARSTRSGWPRSSPRPGCPRACSPSSRPAARSASTW